MQPRNAQEVILIVGHHSERVAQGSGGNEDIGVANHLVLSPQLCKSVGSEVGDSGGDWQNLTILYKNLEGFHLAVGIPKKQAV
ncbi:MAG: hypothetical protein IPJ82_03085 [Lewinellaceae bacterium]|nr:hypothetical protein [Lewinellaceae bacterium]